MVNPLTATRRAGRDTAPLSWTGAGPYPDAGNVHLALLAAMSGSPTRMLMSHFGLSLWHPVILADHNSAFRVWSPGRCWAALLFAVRLLVARG